MLRTKGERLRKCGRGANISAGIACGIAEEVLKTDGVTRDFGASISSKVEWM